MTRFTIVLILFLLVLPVQAHDVESLEVWLDDWQERADVSMSPELVDEFVDMVERHDYYFSPQASVFRPARIAWNGSVEQWRPLVAGHFDPGDVETAMCLMFYESRGDPNAKNPNSTAAGLFQFLRSTWDNMVPASVTGGSYASGQVYQPVANVRSAAWLQNAAGWTQWSPYNRGLCRGL